MNMNNDKVSVIVPVYNEEKYLTRCIDSILKQTYTNLEVILVDDGSKESVAMVCDDYAKADSRVTVIHKENGGLSAARISGLKIATGLWVMFVDNDDIILEKAIELMLYNVGDDVQISAGRSVDTIYADEVVIDSKKCEYEIYSGIEICELIPEDNNTKISTPLWGKLYRKEFLEGFELEKYKDICPTIFFEDVLMTPIIMSRANKVRLLDKVLYVHRDVPTSISLSGKIGKFYYEQIYSGNILLEYCKDKMLNKLYDYILIGYYNTLLRDYCLVREDSITLEQKESIKQDIVNYYSKWWKEYKQTSASNIKKLVVGLFGCFPKAWSNIVYIIYFKPRRKNISV